MHLWICEMLHATLDRVPLPMCMIPPVNATSCASPEDLLTTAQVADLAGRSIATVNRWAAAELLPAAAQANGRVFRRGDVESFLAARTATDAS